MEEQSLSTKLCYPCPESCGGETKTCKIYAKYMEEQDKIAYDNIRVRSIQGPWYTYQKNNFASHGAVIHWMYVYGQITFAEQVSIGDGIVKCGSKHVATFIQDEKLGMPVFTFTKEYEHMQKEQDILVNGLRQGRKTTTGLAERIEAVKLY